VRSSVDIVISVGVDTGTSWTSVVSTGGWNGWLSLVLVVGEGACWRTNGSTGLVGWTEVVVITGVVASCKTASTDSAELSIFLVGSVGRLWAALASEPPVSATCGVVVLWGWAEALLLLVMTSKPELNDGADEEEEGSNDGDCEDDLV